MALQTSIWELAAQALHTPSYRKTYVEALGRIIKDPTLAILDTASGTGFPTIDLYEMGYTNISCVDGDANSVMRLRTLFREKGLSLSVTQAFWQDLDTAMDKTFDVVINTDNSLIYLDGWMKTTTSVPEEGRERIAKVLQNFRQCLKPNGRAIIGACDTYPETVTERTGLQKEIIYQGKPALMTWHSHYDWKHRIRRWTVTVKAGDTEVKEVMESYIVKTEEMTELMKKAGFKDVQSIDTRGEGVYDWLFVGQA